MERIKVREGKSRAILSIGYDKAKQLLELELSSGAVYQYSQFPQDVYDEFVRADSLGLFLATRIRGAYPYERMHGFGCVASKCKADGCPCWCHKPKKEKRK